MEVDYGHGAQANDKAGQMKIQTYEPKPGNIRKKQCDCLSLSKLFMPLKISSEKITASTWPKYILNNAQTFGWLKLACQIMQLSSSLEKLQI